MIRSATNGRNTDCNPGNSVLASIGPGSNQTTRRLTDPHDPSMLLGRLLGTMKDSTGRVTIAGFYDDVTPLTPTEKRALADAPEVEAGLAKEFGVARPERPNTRLEQKLNEPTLNVLQMEAGGGFSAPGRTAIPASATSICWPRF